MTNDADAIAAAQAYESLHVPALFREWTARVLDAAEVGPGHRVLDVACGTGVLARAAAARVGASGEVVGVDPNPGMLAVAKQLAPVITWQQGTADALPCDTSAFDAVVSQFGLMFFPDRLAALREMTRVVVPGGAVVGAVWDALDKSPAYAAEVDLLQRRAGDEAAAALRAPFVLGNADELLQLWRSSGLVDCEVVTRVGSGRFPSIRQMVEADLRGWLPVMGVHLSEELINELLAESEEVLAPFRTETGEVVFDSPAHIAIGRRADQPE